MSSHRLAAGAGDYVFADALLAWFDVHGRRDLPWQHPREPYRVWLSEVMLQQTQVSTVIPYFQRFVARFPTVEALAAATVDEVLQLWAGLGYYARARNLHRAARRLVEVHGGLWPRDLEATVALPGIGRSTGAAILSQAFGDRHAILDGNVKRMLARYGAIAGWPGTPAVQQKLWTLAESLLPPTRLADYTQAIMDLGNVVCLARRPQCAVCPVAAGCAALARGRVHEYPAPKPKRTRPQRRAWLLLVEDDEAALLLERRPPTGIWGGLWCPPAIDVAEDWRQVLLQRHGLRAGEARQLASVHHRFTHYDLELLPLRLRAAAAAGLADSAAAAWIKLRERAEAPGMPAPVRKLIEQTLLDKSPSEDSQIRLWPEPSTA